MFRRTRSTSAIDKPIELTVPERLEVLMALASGMTAELELASLRAENERLRGLLRSWLIGGRPVEGTEAALSPQGKVGG